MKHSLLLIMVLSLFSTHLSATPLTVGTAAPQLVAIDHKGTSIDLGASFNEGVTVVFFYPKALTPGCTKQACSLRDAWDLLKKRNVTVYGVSSDTASTQEQFRNKHELPFTLIADTDKSVSQAFGRGRWSRQAYIFNDGILVWLDLKASTAKQADDVLAALDALGI